MPLGHWKLRSVRFLNRHLRLGIQLSDFNVAVYTLRCILKSGLGSRADYSIVVGPNMLRVSVSLRSRNVGGKIKCLTFLHT